MFCYDTIEGTPDTTTNNNNKRCSECLLLVHLQKTHTVSVCFTDDMIC